MASQNYRVMDPKEPGYIVKGLESQNLRTFCYNAVWTSDSLDDFGLLMQTSTLEEIRAYCLKKKQELGEKETIQYFADIHYGPGKMPIFNYILQLAYMDPSHRAYLLAVTRFLAIEFKVPVDSADLAGNTAFMYSISTKPFLDTEFADIMLQAGADINHRNRYGCVAAHDAVMASDHTPAGRKKTFDALKYFIDKGGDVDASDGDLMTVRDMANKVKRLVPEIGVLFSADEEDLAAFAPAPAAAPSSAAPRGKDGKKVGRNDPCPCNSKRKYKVCCGKN